MSNITAEASVKASTNFEDTTDIKENVKSMMSAIDTGQNFILEEARKRYARVASQQPYMMGSERVGAVQDYSFFDNKHSEDGRILLTSITLKKLRERKRIVHVDLGGGNEGVSRRLKKASSISDYNGNEFVNIVVDINEYDSKKISTIVSGIERSLFDPKYAPKRIIAQAEDASFGDKADIITAYDLLFSVEDPLKIFVNAYNQANVGAEILFNQTSGVRYVNPFKNSSRTSSRSITNLLCTPILSSSLFNKIFNDKNYSSLFEIVQKNSDEFHMIKKDSKTLELPYELVKPATGIMHYYALK